MENNQQQQQDNEFQGNQENQNQQNFDNGEEKDEELDITIQKYPVGVLPLKFRPCQQEVLINKSQILETKPKKDVKQTNTIRTGSKLGLTKSGIQNLPKQQNQLSQVTNKLSNININQQAVGSTVFIGQKKNDERVCSCDPIFAPGIYKLQFSVQIPPKPRNPKEQKPVFYVGIVQDGRQDMEDYGENWAFKKLFGANTKDPDNRGMMGNIDGSWEYGYDIEQDLINEKENQFELILDFDKNLFRIKTPNKKNKYQSIKNYVNLNKCDWRIYFQWIDSTAKLNIGNFERQDSKIKIKDKYGRVVKM